MAMAPCAEAATAIQSFSAETNDRFANNEAFIGADFDFSGVGRDASGRWAVMLSSTVYLSANHYAAAGSLIFYEGNDPSATPITATVLTGERIGTSDLWIGRLDSPLPSSIAFYNYVTIPPAGVGVLMDEFVFMGGISPTTTGYGSGSPDVTDQTVGTNRIEGFQANAVAVGAVGDILFTVENFNGDEDYLHTTHEAQLATGDSGSPLLLVSGESLVVAGIALGVGPVEIGPEGEEETRNATAFTYTGSYSMQIGNYLLGLPIPEPSLALLMVVSIVSMGARRHRSLV